MAELLLLHDDKRGLRGTIIHAARDGFPWGRKECLGVFLVVKVDVPLATAQEWVTPLFDDDGEVVSNFSHVCKYWEHLTQEQIDVIGGVSWHVPDIPALAITPIGDGHAD